MLENGRRSRPASVAIFCLVSLLAFVASVPAGAAQKMYWIQRDPATELVEIRRADPTGSGVEVVLGLGQSGAYFGSMAIDRDASAMYWSGPDPAGVRGIHRAGLDGSNVETVVAEAGARFVALDPAAQKLYWTESDRVRRSDLDGSGIEDLYVGLQEGTGIALDVESGKMYIGDVGGSVLRADLDGSNVEQMDAQGFGVYPFGLAINFSNDTLYFGDGDRSGLGVVNLDPFSLAGYTGQFSGVYFFDVAIDSDAWMAYASDLYFATGIWRTDLFGGGGVFEQVISSGDVRGIALLLGECGDGIVDPGEECDDGNDLPLDGCDPDCTVPEIVPATSHVTSLITLFLLLGGATAVLLRRRRSSAGST